VIGLNEDLLRLRNFKHGIQVVLDIQDLYPTRIERDQFECRLCKFLKSDHSNNEIFWREDDLLVYQTEQIIPKRQDGRIPFLMLLGNPASHSVKEGMFFASERNGQQEHRFWKVLDKSGVFPFSPKNMDLRERNKLRKQTLSDLSYCSPFCIGLAVFYSMPSPSNGKWSGVAGLKRLFKGGAFKKVSDWEQERVKKLITEFVTSNGIIAIFQKDAYESVCRCNRNTTHLHHLAPTRHMQKNMAWLSELKLKYSTERRS